MNNRFNPRTPCGVRPAPAFCPSSFLRFQSTHSLRSATPVSSRRGGRSCVSIHALLAECDCRCRQDGGLYTSFNPRTPCGVRRHRLKNPIKNQGFQSTHSLRSATAGVRHRHPVASGFNPRTPCGVRRGQLQQPFQHPEFQSTHSLRSATRCRKTFISGTGFQSTHSLRSATIFPSGEVETIMVSIHALLAECDLL